MLLTRLFKRDDLLHPISTSSLCPEFKGRGWLGCDKYPHAIVYNNIIFGDTETKDGSGFRIYIEEESVWNAGGPLD